MTNILTNSEFEYQHMFASKELNSARKSVETETFQQKEPIFGTKNVYKKVVWGQNGLIQCVLGKNSFQPPISSFSVCFTELRIVSI